MKTGSIAETVRDKASFHTRNAAFGAISALEQEYFASFLKGASSCSCSHCTGSVSATLRFTIRYSVNIGLANVILHMRVSGQL